MLFVAVYYLKKYSFFVICVNEWNEEMLADEWKTILYINTCVLCTRVSQENI